MNRLIILTDHQARTLGDLLDTDIREMRGEDRSEEKDVYIQLLEEIYEEVNGAQISQLAELQEEIHQLKNQVQALTFEKQLRERKEKK